MTAPPVLDVAAARRLALVRAGLLAAPTLPRARRDAAHSVIGRFGYLQLDTVSVAGARSHALVLMSRVERLDPALSEDLLVPGAPLFEYWGHEASWMPMELWPLFEFRREAWRERVAGPTTPQARRDAATALVRRARDDGPFRSAELDGERGAGWWNWKESKHVAELLWRTGDLAIRERRGFQRVYDLAERVIPDDVRARRVSVHDAHRALILRAFAGHGWAEMRTIADTWRLRRTRPAFKAAFDSLVEDGSVVPCDVLDGNTRIVGWIRPDDLEVAATLSRLRPRADRGVLLTPFDPLLWDRKRVRLLFGFEQVLEIYVPAAKRRFGYFCLPVLAGERLVARADVKAHRKDGVLRVVACHFERAGPRGRASVADRAAADAAIGRHAASLGLAVAKR